MLAVCLLPVTADCVGPVCVGLRRQSGRGRAGGRCWVVKGLDGERVRFLSHVFRVKMDLKRGSSSNLLEGKGTFLRHGYSY